MTKFNTSKGHKSRNLVFQKGIGSRVWSTKPFFVGACLLLYLIFIIIIIIIVIIINIINSSKVKAT